MANNVMQRPMFTGAMPQGGGMPMPQGGMPPMPTAPSSVGTGITSGLIDPAEEQMQAEAGFAKLAGTMGNILETVDTAETVEEAINAVRGDQAPLQQRYAELAEYVGEDDAKKTPETVLAFLQPTFTIMEMVQQGAPQGGIADAMPTAGGGQSPVNFNLASSVQAPGAEEAMMRMATGEQPVRRADGTPPTGENLFPTIPKISVQYPAQVSNLSKSLPYLSTSTNVTAPQLSSTNPQVVQNYASDYMTLLDPYLKNLTGGGGPGMDKRLAQLDPYLPTTKTSAEILNEYQQLLGTGDEDAAKTQAYLALMQAGAKIAGSDKTLLGAGVEAAGDIAPTLSKIAADKAAQDRAIKLAARSEAIQGENAKKAAQLSIAQQAISDAARAGGSVESAILGAAQNAITYGLSLAKEESKTFNDSVVMQWNANNSFAQLPTETFVKLVDGKTDLQNVYRTQDGLKIYKDGKFQKLPEGYVKYDKNAWAAANPSAALNLDGAQKIDILIPDPTGGSASGYNQFAGFYKDGKFMYSPTGNPAEAIVAPRGFLMGSEKDVLKVAEPDSVGRVFVTIKQGPRAGQTFLSSIAGKPIPGAAYSLEPPQRDDKGALVSGNPLVYTIENPGVSMAQMTPTMVEQAQNKVINMTSAITEANEVLPLIGEAVGPLNTVKSWTSNTIGALGPDSWKGMTEYATTERGRARMNLFARNLSRALALSDRYAVAEQNLIRQMAEDPEGFWKNPNMTEVKFSEMMRVLQNELSFNRGVLSDSTEIPQVRTLPTGSANDPIMFSSPGHWESLTIQINNNPQGYRDGKYDGVTVRFTKSEAEARGISVPAGQQYVDVTIGALK